MKFRCSITMVLAVLGAFIFGQSAVMAKQLTYSVGFPPGSSIVNGLEQFAVYSKENGGPDIKIYPMSLLDLKETMPGIRDHIVDMGWVTMPYLPAEYANSNLVADLNMLATTGKKVASPGPAMAGAMTEYILLKCPECIDEYTRQKQVYLGSTSSPEYVAVCTSPFTKLEDFEGKKMRTGSANWGRWAEAMGSVKVTISANEAYEALSQGVVDCAFFAAAEIINFQLIDVIKYITTGVPGGLFAGTGASNINIDAWRGLSDAERKGLIKAAAFNSATITCEYMQASEDALKEARERGIQILEASPELVARSEEFAQNDLKVIAEQFTNNYGVKDAEKKIQTMAGLIDKWKDLTKNYGDRDGLAEIYYDEIFSKIDPATYGMQ